MELAQAFQVGSTWFHTQMCIFGGWWRPITIMGSWLQIYSSTTKYCGP